MENVISRDGTPIAYYRQGTGPPLVLVHGSGATNPVVGWAAVVPALEQNFTVYALDRRGYGESGDKPEYALEREIEDITGVIESIGQPVHLLGHSYGALCALEAARHSHNLRKVILYEPGMSLPGAPLYAQGVVAQLEQRLEAGDREGILRIAYCEIAGIPPDSFQELKASPTWGVRVARAHNVPREARVEEQYSFDANRFREMRTPVLLLMGGKSPPHFQMTTRTIAAALPNSHIVALPGQEHIAMYTAPDLFLDAVLTFLNAPA
jgi:pimeloyl-ACP methyl ester carboxylesterase